jgi:hypothetical protein
VYHKQHAEKLLGANFEMKLLLVLTATIDPGAMTFTVRTDPTMRMADYCNALKQWSNWRASSPWPVDIIFCENSGYPLDNLQRVVEGRKAIRFIQFDGNKYPSVLGKGYGEAKILEHVFSADPSVGNYDYCVKCTGRIFVSNATRVLRILESAPDICSLPMSKRGAFVDSRFFVARPKAFRLLLDGLAESINDTAGIYFEHALAAKISEAIRSGKRWTPFHTLPYYIGVSGSTGERLNGVIPGIKHLLKHFCYAVSLYRAYRSDKGLWEVLRC